MISFAGFTYTPLEVFQTKIALLVSIVSCITFVYLMYKTVTRAKKRSFLNNLGFFIAWFIAISVGSILSVMIIVDLFGPAGP